MEQDPLTPDDRATLLAHIDGKSLDDYDERLYNALRNTSVLVLDEINDRSRRAICKYITVLWHEYDEYSQFDSETKVFAALSEVFFKAYELGYSRKHRISPR